MNPRTLSPAEKARFDQAVDTFRGQGPVSVTPEKLATFLAQTEDVGGSRASRLRWLAIRLENDLFDRGWDALREIYRAAADADPADPLVLHSWGIDRRSAVAIYYLRTNEPFGRAQPP